MKVHLLVGELPLYRELFETPPKGVKYVGKISKEEVPRYYSRINWLKRKIALKLVEILKIPRMMYVKTTADLIHSNRGILILNRKPWVIDIDYASAFVGFNNKKWRERRYRKIVKKFLTSKYCKRIMPWSIAAMKSLLNSFQETEKIKEKMEVIYPAALLYKVKRKVDKEFVTLLFVGSVFEGKGGLEVLKSFEILRKKYDSKLIIKADIPDEIKKKFDFPEIEFYPYKSEVLSREKLLEKFFARADIFVYPTYCDIFGLCLLDALTVGIPIISTDIFAVPEIVENGKNGFLIHSPIRWHDETYLWNPQGGSKKDRENVVKQLVEKISILIEDSSLRRRMGKYSKRLVEKGKFSIKERNKKLKKNYDKAFL